MSGPLFHDECPGCKARIPAGYACCLACMAAVPEALRKAFFQAAYNRDPAGKTEAKQAIQDHLKQPTLPV